MSLWSRIKQLFGKSKRGFVDDFPPKFKTDTCGTLVARFTELRCNGQLLSRSCRYESSPIEGRVNARFTPDEDAPANAELWKQVFDQRFHEFEHGWAAILAQKAPRLEARLQGWLPQGVSIVALIESLELGLISVEANGQVRLAFENSPMLKNHDLTIDLGRENNIKDVAVEG